MSEQGNKMIDVYLAEYNKLKDEQIRRIGYRDNLLYVTLALIGGIVSFTLKEGNSNDVLLGIPWVCVILGWSYLTNDKKITKIGTYFEKELGPHLNGCFDHHAKGLLGWETSIVREGSGRNKRKFLQLLVDLTVFVLSGGFALVSYGQSLKQIDLFHKLFMGWEVLILLLLAIGLCRRADF